MTEKFTDGQQPEDAAPVAPEQKLKLTAGEWLKKIGWEMLDLLKGAAFPFIVMCVFSTTIILFYQYDELAIKILATVFGEGLLIGAFAMFGKQNGAAAYRRKCINDGKRKLGTTDERILWRTGEYSPWKGFVIGLITTALFMVFQIIDCFGEFSFVNFMLDYACGWAIAPLDLIGSGNIPQAYNLLMIVFPVAIHGGFYIFGRSSEEKRQQKIARAEDDKRKGKKKHYYEENERSYERTGRASRVDMSSRKNGKKK